MRKLLPLVLALSFAVPSVALAQQGEKPREVVRGGYAKASIGYQGWFTTPYVSYGSSFAFGGGYEFVDQLAFTIGAEGNFHLATVNGLSGTSSTGPGTSPVQGDFQSLAGLFSLRGAVNFGGRQVKRIQLNIRAGGGVWYSPEARDLEDIDNPLLGFGVSPHGRAIPAIDAALGIEYYTRLSHFSVGVEGEMLGLINPSPGLGGFVPAININVTLKYNFGKPQKKG